jgi:triacylglycerol lipase
VSPLRTSGVSELKAIFTEPAAFPPPQARIGSFPTLVREARSTGNENNWPEAPAGMGRPAMLIPGFLAGDPSLSRMARWLRSGGWETVRPGIRRNVDCMEPAIAALERRLETSVERTGKRALVVGQSRGGTFGWVLAVRRPDLVEALVTLGSPIVDQMATSRQTRVLTYAVAALGTLGVPGLFSKSCLDGDCCERSRHELAPEMGPEVHAISLYSRTDGVVSWQSCLAPGAEHVEISGTHSGMGLNRGAWEQVSRGLEGI